MQIGLVGFSVVVVAQSNNPTILNADFLQYNGIVGSSRALHGDPVTTPVFSQVSFDEDLVVQAFPERIVFTQAASGMAPEDIDCPAIAKGYLKTVPHVPYTALGLNPRAVILNPPFSRLSKVLHAEGNWMAFGGVGPRFELKAAYQMTDRRLTLTLQEAEDDNTLVCEANIHRDVAEANQQMRVNAILSMLDCWKDDLDQFYAIVNQALLLDGGDAH